VDARSRAAVDDERLTVKAEAELVGVTVEEQVRAQLVGCEPSGDVRIMVPLRGHQRPVVSRQDRKRASRAGLAQHLGGALAEGLVQDSVEE
jgi:hypothetical protein